MEYRIQCKNPRCGKVSKAAGETLAFIKKSAAKGMDFIMIECPRCYDSQSFNPQNADGEQKPQAPDVLYACPAETCDGFVVHVTHEKPSFWGCGECGQRWPTRAALFKAITAAVAAHPYRKAAYRKTKSGWKPLEPDDYDRSAYERHVHGEWEKPARKPAPKPTASSKRKSTRKKKRAPRGPARR